MLLLVGAAAWAQAAPYPRDLAGDWSGMLRIGEETMPIEFELRDQGGRLVGALRCGDERIPFSSIELAGDEITLQLAQFGGRLRANIERYSEVQFPTLRGDYTVPDGKGGTYRFWIEAVHNAPVIQKEYPDDPEDATEIWGLWQYELSDPTGKTVESGTLELTPAKGKREQVWAKLASPQRVGVILRGVGSKFPQTLTDEQMEAWAKSGKKPTKADIRTVEGVAFHRFDGQQALALIADLQGDGSLRGRFWVNGEQLAFRATRGKASLVENDDVVEDSRRIEPIRRSTYGFCQGPWGAVSTSRTPIHFAVSRNLSP